MDAAAYLYWFAMFLLAEVLLFVVQLPLRLRDSQALGIVTLVVKAFLATFDAYMIVAVISGFCWDHDFFLAALYCALIGDCVASVVWSVARLLGRLVRRKPERPTALPVRLRRQLPVALLSLVLGGVVIGYGTWNMQTVVCEPHVVESSKLTSRHTFAYLADLHVGTAQQLASLEDVVAQIREAQPDFVILGGDVSDEKTSAEWLERAYELLGTIDAPTYFVYGNHDRQPSASLVGGATYTDDELVATIERNGITVLVDEYVVLSDDIVLLGREDISAGEARQTGDVLAAQNPDASAFLIVADHQPYGDEDDVAALHADLQVSGHTHAGQLFPLQFVYNAVGLPAYGAYQLGGSSLWVSSGEAGWGYPLRTEARSTWNLITLEPAV